MKNFKILLAVAVLSAVSMAITSRALADDSPAQQLVVESVTAMLDALQNHRDESKSDPEYLQSKIDEHVIPDLDFNTMTKLSVGKFWRRADASQQKELVVEFQQLLLNTYTAALIQYSDSKASVSFEPFRPESREDRAVVRSTFSVQGSDDIPVTYKLRDKDGWNVYDIEVNGISLVTSYRSAFSKEINDGGIDGLIETLKKRNAESAS